MKQDRQPEKAADGCESSKTILGKTVSVTVDRPLGSRHPQYSDTIYPVNYGFVEGIRGGDGEEQDAYILGVDEPLVCFTGRVIAIVHRQDDCEDKWIVCPDSISFSAQEIMDQIRFQERYFRTEIETETMER